MGDGAIHKVSIYSATVIEGLKNDLGDEYVEAVDGCIDRNGDKMLDNKDKDGIVQTDEAWEYFFENYNKGKYQSIMAELKMKGFEYPFDLTGPDGKDMRLVNWIDNANSKMESEGIKDDLGKAREFYLRMIPISYGGRTKEEGGLNIQDSDSFDRECRPNGYMLPLEVLSRGYALCEEYSYLYVAILRHIGIESYSVIYHRGDYRLLSLPENWEYWKRNVDCGGGHVYTYFVTRTADGYIADSAVFEKARKPVTYYLNDRKTSIEHYFMSSNVFGRQDRYKLADAGIKVASEMGAAPLDDDCGTEDAYTDNRKSENAIEIYKELFNFHDNSAAHYGLAQVYEQRDDTNEAIKELKKAVKMDPGNVEAFRDLVDINIEEGWIWLAVREAKIAVKNNPDSAIAYYSLARACAWDCGAWDFGCGDNIQKAIPALTKAVSLDPTLIEEIKTSKIFIRFRGDEWFKALMKTR